MMFITLGISGIFPNYSYRCQKLKQLLTDTRIAKICLLITFVTADGYRTRENTRGKKEKQI